MVGVDELIPGMAFKFVAPEWASAVERGSVRIGTLVDFMIMEGSRRDPLEGQVVRRPSGPIRVRPDSSAQEIADFERKTGMVIGPEGGVDVEIHAGQFIQYTSSYCFCMSRRRTAAPPEDHVAFKIDTVAFGRAVTKAYEGRLGTELKGASVQYAPRVGSYDDESLIGLNPFVKDPKFQAEDEYRLFWPEPPRPVEAADTMLDAMRNGLHAFNTDSNPEIAAAIERIG